jgi:hypothetical protein
MFAIIFLLAFGPMSADSGDCEEKERVYRFSELPPKNESDWNRYSDFRTLISQKDVKCDAAMREGAVEFRVFAQGDRSIPDILAKANRLEKLETRIDDGALQTAIKSKYPNLVIENVDAGALVFGPSDQVAALRKDLEVRSNDGQPEGKRWRCRFRRCRPHWIRRRW